MSTTIQRNDGRKYDANATTNATKDYELNGATTAAKLSQPICQRDEQHQQR